VAPKTSPNGDAPKPNNETSSVVPPSFLYSIDTYGFRDQDAGEAVLRCDP